MNSNPTRVLLLDDDPNLRGILSDILNMKGYQPVPASTGAAALALLEQQQVQVALIDLKLEDVSGLEILRLIKTRSPATECIMLTGNATQGSAIEAINLGAYSYFQKPYEVDQLLVAIRRAAEKHASDAALLEREARFRSMIENSSDVICILNQDASLRYVSPSSERILGYALTEVEGISLQDFIHPEDLPSFLEAYQRVLQSPEPVSLRLRMQHKDGAWRTLEGIGRNLLADPAIQGIIINARDITARLLAEAALQQAEVRFRTLVEHSPAITYIVSPGLASPVTYISPQIEQVLGFSPAEWMAQPGLWETLLYPEDRESALADGDWSAPTGEPFISEYRIYTKDGRLVWLHDENIQVRDEQGRLLFIQGIETDITARKQAEQALKESQQSYQSLVEQVPGVFYRDNLDENASSLFVSPQIQDLIGYSPDEWRADPDMWVNRLHPDDHDRILAENKHHLVTGEKLDSEYRLLARAGHVVWVRDQAIIFRDAAGQPLYDQGTLIDITARKQAEERLSKLNQCFLSFGADPLTNINLLVAFTGEAFGATVALYNQLQGEMLCSLGTWNTPPGYRTSDPAGGHICTDVIQSGKDEIVVLRNLQESSYASSDPNVSQYHLQTYIGKPVRFENANIGSLCIVFQKDVIPSDDDQRLLGIVASAMGVEEQRRRAGDELHASEERYRMLAENITDTVWLMDLSLRTTYISPSVTRLRGYTLQELNAIPLDRQVSPDSLQRALQLFAEVLSPQSLAQPVTNGGSNTIELEFIKKDGSTFWSENTFSLIRDPQGAPLAILGSGRDISERKQVEEKLRNSEKYYRLLTENNTDAVVLLDPRGMVLYESPAYARMMGWSTGQRLGKSSFEHLHPQDRESIARLLTELVQNPSQVRQAEFRVQHKDGSWHWIEATATNLLGETAVHGLVVNMHDITEHIQSEAEIRRRVADLEVLYENGLSISVLLDPRQIAEQMINILSKKLNWHHAAIRLYHPESKRLELLALSRPGLTPTETRSEIERLNQNITYPPQGLSGWVFTHARTIRSGEVQADERYLSTFSDMHSGLYVPLLVGKQAIGSIAVESREPDLFSEDDEHLLQTLAAQSAIAFENARLYQEALSADRRKSALHQAGLEIVRAGQDIEALSQALHQAVGQVMPAEIFVVSLITSDGRSVDAPYYLDQGVRQPNSSLPLKAGMTGRVIRSRKSLRVKDVQTLRGPKPIMSAGAQPPRSFLAVPLILQDKIVGVLTIASREVNVYSKEDQIFLETLASEAAVAFENARLFQAVVREAERRLVLYRTGQEIVAAGLDLEQVYRSIHQAASELIPLDLLTIVLADEGQHVLHALYLFDKGQRYPAFDMQWDSGLSGHVIRIQKSLLLADYTRQKEVRSVMFGDASEPRAILAVPLRSGARIVGVLSVQSYAPDVYREEDQILLEMLASYAGTAIENSRLFEAERGQHLLSDALRNALGAGASLSRTLDSVEVRDRLLEAIEELLPWDDSTLMLMDAQTGEAVVAVAHSRLNNGDRKDHSFENYRFSLAKTDNLRWMAEHHQALVIPDVSAYPGWVKVEGTEMIQSWIGAPIVVNAQVVAFFSLSKREPNFYTPEHVRLLEAFTGQASLAFQNARLFEETRRRLAEMESLSQVSLALASVIELQPLLENILSSARQAIPAAEKGAISLSY